jgi:hypothetical protein
MHTFLFQYVASLGGLLRLIIILLLVYVVYRFFVSTIAPSLFKHFVNEFQKQHMNANPPQQEQTPKEGTITIKKDENKQKKENSDNIGEYVDYEDIK